MKPLEGIKVVDLTTYLAAPTTVRVLGEWGADCVKIESAKGDPARTQGAVFNMPYSDEENLAFDKKAIIFYNRSKILFPNTNRFYHI